MRAEDGNGDDERYQGYKRNHHADKAAATVLYQVGLDTKWPGVPDEGQQD